MAATGEGSEWFRRLPRGQQDEYRARWAGATTRERARHGTRKRSFLWGAVRGALVLGLTHVAFGFGGWGGIALAAGVGAALGIAWTFLNAGPLQCAVSAAPVYAVVWLHTTPSTRLVPLLFFGAIIVMSLAAAAGHMREFRQGDDEE